MQQKRCAYCERSLQANKKHIEHFRQRGRFPEGAFDWNNLFGSCDNAGSCGKHKDQCGNYQYQDLIKPDVDDPEHFFFFMVDGTIKVKPNLTPIEEHRANETLRVLNLNDHYGPLRQMRESAVKSYIDTVVKDLFAFGEIADSSELVALFQEEWQKELQAIQNQPFSTALKHILMSPSEMALS